MKSIAIFAVVLLLSSLLRADDPKATETDAWRRTWRDKTGKFSTDAIFGGMDNSVVTLHKMDGATVKIPLEGLSKVDRDWIFLRMLEESRSEPKAVSAPVVVPAVTSKTNNRRADKWYEGGTLHQKSALDWQRADAADKLATCADLVAAMWNKRQFNSDIQSKIKSVEDMKHYAKELVRFLDAATEKFPDDTKNRQIYTNQTVTDMTIFGVLMMGWTK